MYKYSTRLDRTDKGNFVEMVREEAVAYLNDTKITGPDEVWDLFKSMGVADLDIEQMWLLCLDTKNKINALFMVSQGSSNSTVAEPREVFKRAVICNSTSIILAHNHPSGDCTPSKEDKIFTKRIVEAGKTIGVKVLDHIIVSPLYGCSLRRDYGEIFE